MSKWSKLQCLGSTMAGFPYHKTLRREPLVTIQPLFFFWTSYDQPIEGFLTAPWALGEWWLWHKLFTKRQPQSEMWCWIIKTICIKKIVFIYKKERLEINLDPLQTLGWGAMRNKQPHNYIILYYSWYKNNPVSNWA